MMNLTGAAATLRLPGRRGIEADALIEEARDRQRRRRRWLVVVGACVVVAAASYGGFREAGGGGSAAATPFHVAGLTVSVPPGWFITTAPLNAITNPVPRFVLSSYRLPAGADAGDSYVPPSSALLVQVVEEEPPLYSKASLWPPRPRKVVIPRLGRMETLSGNRWAELYFRAGRRHLYLFVWIGRGASHTDITVLLRTLDAMKIAARFGK